MSSILLPKASVILFLALFSSKDKAKIHFEERDGITSQLYHLFLRLICEWCLRGMIDLILRHAKCV